MRGPVRDVERCSGARGAPERLGKNCVALFEKNADVALARQTLLSAALDGDRGSDGADGIAGLLRGIFGSEDARSPCRARRPRR